MRMKAEAELKMQRERAEAELKMQRERAKAELKMQRGREREAARLALQKVRFARLVLSFTCGIQASIFCG